MGNRRALWPKGINDKSVRVFTAGVRRWLGQTPNGEPWLPDASDTEQPLPAPARLPARLAPLRRLKTRARQRGHAGIDDLRAALALVRGRPLAGADSRNNGRNQYSLARESDINPPTSSPPSSTPHTTSPSTTSITATPPASAGPSTKRGSPTPTASTTNPGSTSCAPNKSTATALNCANCANNSSAARDAEVPEDLAPATFREVDGLLRG